MNIVELSRSIQKLIPTKFLLEMDPEGIHSSLEEDAISVDCEEGFLTCLLCSMQICKKDWESHSTTCKESPFSSPFAQPSISTDSEDPFLFLSSLSSTSQKNSEETNSTVEEMAIAQQKEVRKYLLVEETPDVSPREINIATPLQGECPVCSNNFPLEQLENHVNSCLDEPSPASPSPVSDTPSSPQEAYIEDQRKAMEYWQRQVAQRKEESTPAPGVNLLEDERLALEMQQKEKEEYETWKEKEEEDRRLAEELMEIEREANEKQEFQTTMELVRLEAKAESDEMLSKLLREKEELAAQLELAQNRPTESFLTLNGIEYPEQWEPQVSPFQTFDLDPSSSEYQEVANKFSQGLPQAHITRIERNQNQSLWMWYYLRRQVVSANNQQNPNEQFLFHGSRLDAYDTILKDGLDHRVANLKGSIGAGIYFALSSGTSNSYVPGKATTKKMLYCRVVLGSVGPGKAGLRRPPERSKGVLHDSVGNALISVIFDNHQSYPDRKSVV